MDFLKNRRGGQASAGCPGRPTAACPQSFGNAWAGFFIPVQLFIEEKGVEFDAGSQTVLVKGYFIALYRTVFASHAPVKRTIHLYIPFFKAIPLFINNDYSRTFCFGSKGKKSQAFEYI